MAVNKRDLNTLTDETGWPFVNYAQEERNLQSAPGNIASALSIPRFKFTWAVEFQFSPRALDNPITNLADFINDRGRLYVHLISINHPSSTIKTEKLRSYNKWINVPTQVEHPSASMTFHDDSTSVVQALWKENLNFYTHQATIGDTLSGNRNTNLSWSDESNSYQFTDDLTSTDGGEMRSSMGRRPSLGMRLKPNDGRHFFESIKIIDLGTEPDGLNVYWYHRPIITGWDIDALDKEDRTGNVRVTASFDYESTYFTIGQYRGRFAGEGATNGNGSGTVRKAGIARDGLEGRVNRPVELTEGIVAPATIRAANEASRAARAAAEAAAAEAVVEPALESELNPIIPGSLAAKQRDLDQVQAEKDAIKEGRVPLLDPEARLAELDEREADLNEAIKDQKQRETAGEFASPEEKSALANTSEAAEIPTASPDRTGDEPESASILDVNKRTKRAEQLEGIASTRTNMAVNQEAEADEKLRAADKADEAGKSQDATNLRKDAAVLDHRATRNREIAKGASDAAITERAGAETARIQNEKNASLNDE